MDWRAIIEQWKLNRRLIAVKIGMPFGTFQNKYSLKQKKYKFTMEEEQAICKVLLDLSNQIKQLCNQ